MTIQVSDIVRAHVPHLRRQGMSDYGFGVVLDTYEDDYGILYYEVYWTTEETGWWKESELELVREGG